MGIVKASKLIFEYIRRDEEENIEEVKRAIDDVDVDIKQGDFVAVLGHNGSGKSTFAKHINGILMPSEGTVLVSGIDTRDEDHIWDVRRTAGMVLSLIHISGTARGGDVKGFLDDAGQFFRFRHQIAVVSYTHLGVLG